MTFIASVLPAASVTILYRQVVSSLSTYVVDRMIIHLSRGKLDPENAGVLAMEYQLWVECSKQSVGRLVRRIEVPWERLRDAATILGMNRDDFSKLVEATWSGSKDLFEEALRSAGVSSFEQNDVRQVLRLRSDCVR